MTLLHLLPILTLITLSFKAVSTYVKKIRMDMVVPVRQETNDDQPSNDVNDDEVERFVFLFL